MKGRYFAGMLIKEIKANGLTQKELADRCGVTATSMSRYCSGDRFPRIDTLIGIADELNVSPNYLLGYESKANENPSSAYEEILRALLKNVSEMALGEKTQLMYVIADSIKKGNNDE